MHRSLTFHMLHSGQYFTNTEEAPSLQLKLSIKGLRKSCEDSNIVKKMAEQAISGEIVSETDFNLRNSANG